MNFDSLKWRSRVLKTKTAGQLPSLPWTRVPRLMAQPFEDWNYTYFATPVHDRNGANMVSYETPIGRFVTRHEDRSSLGCVIVEEICRIYERPPVVLRPGDIVIDLGAHVGTFTRVALNAGAKVVIAFEPDTINASCFRVTFEQEIANGTVILVDCPVWSEPSLLRFSGNGLIGQVGEKGELRQTVTVDAVIRDLGLPRVDFIKTDIEGGERHALKGAARVLSSFAPRLAISTYHCPDDPAVLRKTVLEYHPYDITFDKGNKRMFCLP